MPFRKRECEVYCGDMRVQVNKDATCIYPDGVIVCGAPRFRDDLKPDTLENPLLIAEILSPTTAARRQRKRLDLQRLFRAGSEA